MIFVTVGGQLPFDRLILEVEKWHDDNNIQEDVIVQCGDTSIKSCKFKMVERLSYSDFQKAIEDSLFVVSHAGMGNILSCLDKNKVGVFYPRLKKHNEHRNDHQIDTVSALKGTSENLYFAENNHDLCDLLTSCMLFSRKSNKPMQRKTNPGLESMAAFISSSI